MSGRDDRLRDPLIEFGHALRLGAPGQDGHAAGGEPVVGIKADAKPIRAHV